MAVRLWKGYLQLLKVHPFKVQVISSGILVGIGDCCSQQLVERKGWKHDWYRTAGMTLIGSCVIAPLLRYWYIALDHMVKGTRMVDSVKKAAIDQTFFAPFIIATFFTTTNFLFGKSIEDLKMKFQNQYLSTLKRNYIIWPFVQVINFTFVPLQQRVLLVNFVAIFWNTYLTWAASKSEESEIVN